MDTRVARQTLHELVDRIEDNEVLNLYVKLLEREIARESIEEFFKTDDNDLITRAKDSLKSIKEGNVRDIKDFKKDVEEWKKNRSIK